MPKLTKRTLDALQHSADKDVFVWDSELRGFGVRLKPSGTKTFLIQYRNEERRTRRFVIGQYDVLTVELARDLAQKNSQPSSMAVTLPQIEKHPVRVSPLPKFVTGIWLKHRPGGSSGVTGSRSNWHPSPAIAAVSNTISNPYSEHVWSAICGLPISNACKRTLPQAKQRDPATQAAEGRPPEVPASRHAP